MEAVEETERCLSCGQDIPVSRYRLRQPGPDGSRPECPKQDLVEIALRTRGDWDALRARYEEVPQRWRW
jgi:hypothetical protein